MKRLLLAMLLLPLLIACQTNKVSVDFDTEADFKSFQYYQWLPEKSGSSKDFDPLMAERVRDALGEQLPNTGMKPASENHAADILVRYFMAASTKSQSSESRGSVGIGGASGGGGSSTAMGMSLSIPMGGNSVKREAQIIVDFIDANDQKLKWRGSRNLKFSDEAPEKLTAMVQEVVAEIIAHYPPGKKPK
jgi:uncharacterized protein DUF4136